MSKIVMQISLVNEQGDRLLEISRDKDKLVFAMRPIHEDNSQAGYEMFETNLVEFIESFNKIIK
ncbi:MAG: hypothetical protein P4N59_00195 [Negativicutes bacterium]|nr:hypothetical protein [Negativicutes bacterium]